MASSSARACLASRASSSAVCARNSTAVSLSSAATIRDWASFRALAASCSLQSELSLNFGDGVAGQAAAVMG